MILNKPLGQGPPPGSAGAYPQTSVELKIRITSILDLFRREDQTKSSFSWIGQNLNLHKQVEAERPSIT